jgi:transcriptional regulator with XRE-family HTH domain
MNAVIHPFELSEIAKRLKALRKATGKTQDSIGRLAGVSAQAWQNYEAGIRRIEVNAVARLCMSLNVSFDWVYWGRVDNMPRDFMDRIDSVTDLLNGKSHKIDQAIITAWWRNASKNDRIALIRNFGPADTWDALSTVVS